MIEFSTELNEMFQQESKTLDQVKIIFTPQETISYFIGHFPSMPILPAVAIIDMSQYFIHCFFKDTNYQRINEMSLFRIKHPIIPDTTIKIEIKRNEHSLFYILWTKINDEKLLAEINLKMAVSEDYQPVSKCLPEF